MKFDFSSLAKNKNMIIILVAMILVCGGSLLGVKSMTSSFQNPSEISTTIPTQPPVISTTEPTTVPTTVPTTEPTTVPTTEPTTSDSLITTFPMDNTTTVPTTQPTMPTETTTQGGFTMPSLQIPSTTASS